MKRIELTLDILKKVLRESTSEHTHIYIPFDDLIVIKEPQDESCTYYLVDRYTPQRRFIDGRNYLEVYVSDDLQWMNIKTNSATNHLKGIAVLSNFFKKNFITCKS